MSKDISKDTENPFETTSRKYGLLPESIAGTVESGYRRPLRFSQRPGNRWFVHVYHDRSKNGEGAEEAAEKRCACSERILSGNARIKVVEEKREEYRVRSVSV